VGRDRRLEPCPERHAARTLQTVNNQITQIQQAVQMLENQARNLTNLPTSLLGSLTSDMTQLTQLMNQAQGIVYDVQRAEQQFQQLYPQSYSPSTSASQFYQDAQNRWQTSMQALQQSVSTQSRIVTDITADQQNLNQAVTASQGAVGILQATQATNQLIALQAKQTAELQALLAAHGRAEDTEAARQAETEEAAHVQWQQFIGSGIQYTPQPVQIFNGQ
jgi:P-type conjugative transfer protein TrbJ